MNVILRHGDTFLLDPVREIAPGWQIRPGTFRVAQPYDKPRATPELHPADQTTLGSTEHTADPDDKSNQSSARPIKKRKVSKVGNAIAHDESDQSLWISTQLSALLALEPARQFFEDAPKDYFFGTCPGTSASEDYALDLVTLQPTFQMLHSGFASPEVAESRTGRQRRNDGSQKPHPQEEILFGELCISSLFQAMDLGDLYECVVTNTNDENKAALMSVMTEGQPHYLLPPRSGFVISDLDRIHGLTGVARQRKGFDIIVMDPPWQNASVDRMSHYNTMDLYDLFKVPVMELVRQPITDDEHLDARVDQANDSSTTPELLEPTTVEGSIVAVWITNRAKIKRVVLEKLFPAWGLEYIDHWTWLKVTTAGEPVLSLDNHHRKPYESVLIGRHRQQGVASPCNAPQPAEGPSKPSIQKRMLVSIPSQHSRKPSIFHLLEQEFFQTQAMATATNPSSSLGLVENPASACNISQQELGPRTTCLPNNPTPPQRKRPLNRLELFARNLEEGVLSWGNEPIRYQYCGRSTTKGVTNPDGSSLVQDGFLVPSQN